jgi:asparagine synthase (glutamine-hydrolysing)
MTELESFIAIGQPEFADAQLQRVANADGIAVAWQSLLDQPDADCRLDQVGGDFAMARIDAMGHGLAVVDRFATRSLCWQVREGRLRVAVRADELADESTDIDPQAIYDYLYFHSIPSPRTIFKGIHRLPAAHALRFDGRSVRIWRYWTPEFAPRRVVDFSGLKTEFLALLKQGVTAQLDGSKPACFLSGGTDSSSVAGLIQSVTGQGADGYSIGFEAQGYDEMEYARLAARRFGVNHHEYYVTAQDIADGIHRVAAYYDQPFGNSSALPAYYCARMAHDDGVTRLLAGDGGDELFGGNARYATQRILGWYRHVPAGLRKVVVEPLVTAPFAKHVGVLRKGASYVEQANVAMPRRLNMYNLLLRVGPAEVLSEQMLDAVDDTIPLQHQQAVWEEVQDASHLNTTLAFDWRYTLAESDLPKVVGMTAMAGVQVGFPLLDRGLIDFSLRLPDHYKLRGLQLRWFFKEALRGFLPDEIIAKGKHGFGLPFGVWVQTNASLSRIAREALYSIEARGVLRPGFATRLWQELLPLHPAYYGELVWILTTLELWFQARKPAFRLT